MSIDTIPEWIALALSVIGAVSIIVRGLAELTAITPGTRDDEIVGKAQKGIQAVQKVLGAISLDTAKKQAKK